METSFFSTYSVGQHIPIFGLKSNHLGNVLNVITDRKLPIQLNSTGKVDYYTADVVAYNDYMPFGALMEGRHGYEGKKTNRGYQHSEMDDEIKGEGNSYTTQFRQLDPRLGRWFSIDPKANEMPWQSPYCSMDNNPIWYNDPLGDVAGKPKNHTVQKGDNLWTIAKNHGTTVKEIAKLNNIKENSVIQVGQVLKMPSSPGHSKNNNKASNNKPVGNKSHDANHDDHVGSNIGLKVQTTMGQHAQGRFTLETSVTSVLKKGKGYLSQTIDGKTGKLKSTTMQTILFPAAKLSVSASGDVTVGIDAVSVGTTAEGNFILDVKIPNNSKGGTWNMKLTWDPKDFGDAFRAISEGMNRYYRQPSAIPILSSPTYIYL